MQHTISHIYEDYKKTNDSISKDLFVALCGEFNIGIIDYLLEGKEFNMGSNLSTISITRHDRDTRNPRIDWGESNKYRKELLAEGKSIYDSILIMKSKNPNFLYR